MRFKFNDENQFRSAQRSFDNQCDEQAEREAMEWLREEIPVEDVGELF